MCSRFASGGGLLTATSLDVCALNLGETGLDPRIDTGVAVTALGMPGRSRLTATGHIVSVRVPLPAGEIGVTASGHTLCRVALVTASGHAGDYLPLLPARGQARKDGWPGEISRRVLRRLSLSLLLFLKCRLQLLLLQEELFLSALPSVVQDLARFCLSLSRSFSLGAVCGRGCTDCWVWVQLCPSTSAACAVTLGAATAMPAGAGDPPAPRGCAWASAASGGFPLSWASASLAQWWVRLTRSVTGGGLLHLCFLLIVRSSTTGLPRFFEVMDPVFFRPLLVAPSLEAPQRGSARFCG